MSTRHFSTHAVLGFAVTAGHHDQRHAAGPAAVVTGDLPACCGTVRDAQPHLHPDRHHHAGLPGHGLGPAALVGFYTDKRRMPYSLPFAPALTFAGLVMLGFAGNYPMILAAAA
jgi:hypothetical protein